ncbi:hypothetical protein ANOM_010257 [Aspergillus nomiae NRRL 13137]|uniref:Rhodopsin domain-containing protein n=1 Tax=Aspergillus nomiae NRRL (strain ATCC 15546 / NRRL 13137 / CBS 260.88 / M93) TaxID=1509407 RepID=A0A0L1IRM8_ASPN3|nr:uncharacterized protein ANOM_010257 [Aspergillus nomiae NRRL 13137]KNG82020.1 hypothetical protein ANOM_010257 [Aspergillus nomiae NRRL 13137]
MSNHPQTGFGRPFFIVTWVETGLALILLSARCYTSWKIVRYTGPDLILAIITFIFGIASMALITVGAAYGVGTPSATLTYNDDRNALLFGWTSQAVSLIAIGLGKVALVVFIEHLQEYETKSKRAFLWFIAGSNFIVNVIAAILVFLQCSPAKKLWDEQIPGRCPGRKRVQIFGYIQAPYSAFCDFALAVYPVLIFRKVQAFSLRQKIGLSVLMGLGIVAGACTIVKTVKLKLLTKVEDTTCTYSREALTLEAKIHTNYRARYTG